MQIAKLAAIVMMSTLAYASEAASRKGPEPVLPADTKVLRDVAYVANGHERQVLDLYLPKSDKPLPLIIWVHGGAWRGGSKDRTQAVRLLDSGYAVASINYRLSQHALFPAQIEDCKAAVRWLRANAGKYNLDPKRFGAWGSSAGGHLVALLGLTGDIKTFDVGANLEHSSKVLAVVDFFGPTHFYALTKDQKKDVRIRHDTPDAPEAQLIGGSILEKPAEAKAASPVTYVNKGDAPMLIVHGDQDPVVPYEQSVALHEELKRKGIESELVTVKGAGHGDGFGRPEFERVKAFFNKHLNGSVKE